MLILPALVDRGAEPSVVLVPHVRSLLGGLAGRESLLALDPTGADGGHADGGRRRLLLHHLGPLRVSASAAHANEFRAEQAVTPCLLRLFS